MRAGDRIVIDGAKATVIKVRKTAPVAVIEFDDGYRWLHWCGDEPSAPVENAQDDASTWLTDTPVRSPSKASQSPETPAQAQEWQRAYGWYDRAGLCPRCSAQGAWGVQLGYSNVKPPCNPCAVLVAGFPAERSNGWRRLHRHTALQYALTASA